MKNLKQSALLVLAAVVGMLGIVFVGAKPAAAVDSYQNARKCVYWPGVRNHGVGAYGSYAYGQPYWKVIVATDWYNTLPSRTSHRDVLTAGNAFLLGWAGPSSDNISLRGYQDPGFAEPAKFQAWRPIVSDATPSNRNTRTINFPNNEQSCNEGFAGFSAWGTYGPAAP